MAEEIIYLGEDVTYRFDKLIFTMSSANNFLILPRDFDYQRTNYVSHAKWDYSINNECQGTLKMMNTYHQDMENIYDVNYITEKRRIKLILTSDKYRFKFNRKNISLHNHSFDIKFNFPKSSIDSI